MDIQFGDFASFCRSVRLPICNIMNLPPPECTTRRVAVSEEASIGNLGDIVAAGVTFLMTFLIIYRTYTKFAAVGRKEMNILFLWYLFIMIAQILSTGDFLARTSPVLVYSSAIHVGLVAAAFWMLLINGIVGYQVMEDGTVFTTSTALLSSLLIAAGTTFIGLDTAYGISKSFGPGILAGATGASTPYNSTDTKSVPLFILYFVWPVAAGLVYLILQIVLVTRHLGQKKPLFWLLFAAVMFSGSQVLMLYANPTVCEGLSGVVDGSLFATLAVFLSLLSVFLYWSSITEDEWDEMDEA